MNNNLNTQLSPNVDYDLEVEKREKRRKIASKIGKFVILAILIIWALFTFWPLYWMLITSFKDTSALSVYPPELFPSKPTLDTYKRVFESAPIWRWLWNSFFIASAQTFTDVIFATLAGYAFSKLTFPGRDKIFWIMLCTMMIPGQVTLIPLYILIINKFQLGNTYFALIVPGIVGIGHIFLMKQYMSGLPSSLIDAARIDACSEFGIFTKIILPLAKPGIACLAIFKFVASWNGFFWPFLVTSEKAMRTIQVGLSTFKFEHMQDYGAMMAGSVIAALPMIVLFLSMQKYFLKGITVGAVKG
jgi:multiple sugar transport system permease protein